MTFVISVSVLIVACVCGAAGLIGGKNISKGSKSFNYYANIICNDEVICGGSIINDHIVLTAAHCLRSNDPKDYGILVGINGKKKMYPAEKIIPYPTYTSTMEAKHDIAYIKVRGKIQFNEYVQPIHLATTNPKRGHKAHVLGLGPIKDNDLQMQLGYLKIMDSKKCNKNYENFEGTICTLEKSKIGICIGDSGGPVANHKGELVGIVSYKDFPNCTAGGPVFFTSVVYYKSFIDGAFKQ